MLVQRIAWDAAICLCTRACASFVGRQTAAGAASCWSQSLCTAKTIRVRKQHWAETSLFAAQSSVTVCVTVAHCRNDSAGLFFFSDLICKTCIQNTWIMCLTWPGMFQLSSIMFVCINNNSWCKNQYRTITRNQSDRFPSSQSFCCFSWKELRKL